MQTHSQLVLAGVPWRLNGDGSYFRLMESVEAVNVRLFRLGRVVYDAQRVEPGFYSVPDGGFDAVEVATTVNPQAVKVAISQGQGGYDRYTGSVEISTGKSVVNTGLINVAAVATPLLAADTKRKGFRVLNSGANVIYLGGGGVSLGNGCLKLNPGDLWVESEAPGAAWFAVADGGPGTVKVQELLG